MTAPAPVPATAEPEASPLDDAALEALLALDERATPAPWRLSESADSRGIYAYRVDGSQKQRQCVDLGGDDPEVGFHDTLLAVAARNALRPLVLALRAARASAIKPALLDVLEDLASRADAAEHHDACGTTAPCTLAFRAGDERQGRALCAALTAARRALDGVAP